MPAPLRVVHETDPRQAIVDDVGELCKHFHPVGDRVLLVMYERGKQGEGQMAKTAGGILIPEHATGVLKEDKYQGKVGLVMALGPIAFTEDADHQWGDRPPVVGDWVLISVGNSFSFDLPGDRRARVVHESYVEMIVDDEAFDSAW